MTWLARASPFLWFLLPALGGVVVALVLDLGEWLTGHPTFSQAMDVLGTRSPWVKAAWLAGGCGLTAMLYWHFWIQE